MPQRAGDDIGVDALMLMLDAAACAAEGCVACNGVGEWPSLLVSIHFQVWSTQAQQRLLPASPALLPLLGVPARRPHGGGGAGDGSSLRGECGRPFPSKLSSKTRHRFLCPDGWSC